MTSKELIAAFKALDAREEAAHRAFWEERVRLTAALRAAEAEELHARIKRLLKTWPADVLDALRRPAPPLPRTSAYTALVRRKLVHAAEFPRTGVTVVSWTHKGLVARKLLEAT